MVKPIIFKRTENSPEVILDKENNVFQISGRSLLIDALQFYSPIISWFKVYFKKPNLTTKLSLNLDYINSPSLLQLMKIINLFDKNKNNNTEIIWMYNKEDERAKESGEELNLITEIKVQLKETESEDFENFNFEL